MILAAVERVVLTLWVGALWAIGYIAAPVLFGVPEAQALAGRLAGEMFTAVSYLSLAAAAMLLLIRFLRRRWRPLWQPAAIGAMLALIVAGEFGVRPLMSAAAPAEFGRLHGIAQGIYLLVSLLGLILVAAPQRKGALTPDPSPGTGIGS
jgi:hypothetical protein